MNDSITMTKQEVYVWAQGVKLNPEGSFSVSDTIRLNEIRDEHGSDFSNQIAKAIQANNLHGIAIVDYLLL